MHFEIFQSVHTKSHPLIKNKNRFWEEGGANLNGCQILPNNHFSLFVPVREVECMRVQYKANSGRIRHHCQFPK